MSEPEEKRTDIGELGEFGLIDRLASNLTIRRKETIMGVGDDAAVLDYGGDPVIVTTDMLIEGIHFDMMYYPLKHLGYKAIVVNLSDICAMNAIPRHVTVSIAVSNRFSVEALEELYSGIRTACEAYGVDLVGGDTSASLKGLIISVTALGSTAKERITYRSGAKPGDILCVTGDLGAAYLGLQILEREKQVYLSNPEVQPELSEKKYLIGRQLKPEARLEAVQYFQKKGLLPTSMIDISDGLASDLMHICKSSGTGAFIEEAQVPIHDEARLQALEFHLDPITCALHGGEDYELLFTVDPKDLEKVRFMESVYIIGEIVPKSEGLN
ncbi:MAG TPA: thiamine-phosphate kinase, partial [Saprospiraceae bacterium]|nr:thiamine-phosphate kinase [Saprospiraceae bacterium]